MEKIKAIFTPEVRGYIYRVLIAVGAIVAAYGWIAQEQVAQWLGLAAVVLNVMPAVNTSVKKDSES